MKRSGASRWIAMVIVATMTVSAGATSAADVPVRELGPGVSAKQISVSSTGEVGDDDSTARSISDDGRLVGFSSRASNLSIDGVSGTFDVWATDRLTGETESITGRKFGASAGAIVSGDGSVAVFRSTEEIIPGVGNGQFQAYVRDRSTGEVIVASVSDTGELADQGILGEPQVSDDGRYVGFGTLSTNLIEGDTNDAPDYFLFDVVERRIERVSLAFDGSEANGGSGGLLTGNGDSVLLVSSAGNLVEPVEDPRRPTVELFVRDLRAGTTTRVPFVRPTGSISYSVQHVSDDGRWAMFFLTVRNPVPDRDNRSQVWLLEVDTGEATLVSRTADGAPAFLNSGVATLSGNGRYVAFLASPAQAPGDRGGVYRYDRVTDTYTFVAEIGPRDLAISDDGAVIAADTRSVFDHRDTNDETDVYAFTIEQREECPADTITITGSGRIEGTNGDDVILGSPGADVIDGYGGNDVICGGGGDDLLRGGAGNDVLNGGDGDDDLVGGPGSDHLVWGPGDDTFRGGPDQDTADYRNAPGPIQVRIGHGRGDGVAGENDDVQNSIEVVLGSGFDDLIVGSVESNIIDGNTGNDRLRGGAGADLIRGDLGDDRIQGGPGDDTLTGNQDDDIVRGDDGNDLLIGATGNDRLIGGPEPDTLNAGPGNDYCRGSAGADTYASCETADP